MLTAEPRASHPLTVADLAPLRRMLGSHSMVIRVNEHGDLMPFEIMPELFLGRSIRQLLTIEVREQFEDACRHVVAMQSPHAFVADGFAETDEVMITPILDDAGERCQFLVCWARNGVEDPTSAPGETSLRWSDLDLDQVEIRYRTIGRDRIEAAPCWKVGDEGIDLWTHPHHVASLGLAAPTMAHLVTESIAALAGDDVVGLRLDVPAPEMLNGLLQVAHGSLRAAGVDPARIVLGIPVDMAVDHDLLPVIVHLRTLGVQIDIVGLDALTAKLHTVSDTSDHEHSLPTHAVAEAGEWTFDAASAIYDAARS